MTIGFDIDNTMTDTNRVINEVFLKSEYSIYAKHYSLLPNDLRSEFIAKYKIEFRKKDELKTGVIEVFNYLNENNHDIVIITRRGYNEPDDIISVTNDNLKKWKLKFKKIYFKSTDKGLDALKDNVKIYFDDHIYNLDSINKQGIKAVHFNNEEKNNAYDSVNNWEEVLEYIKKEGF